MSLAREPAGADTEPDGWIRQLEAVTLDFGNTLVPVDRAALRGVVAITARAVAARLGPFDESEVLTAWAEERERQFREEVPQFREVDLAQRFVRVLARLRGMPAPPVDQRWDQPAAASRSTPDEISWAVEVYSGAFVDAIPPPGATGRALERLADRFRLAVLSNWPLATTVDRYVEAAGWDRWLDAVVVSQRVGTIKPHPAIYGAALEALGGPGPERVLHVGDDWLADVVGAKRCGWRAAWLTGRPADSPLPVSERDDAVVADLEVDSLDDLVTALEPATTSGSAAADNAAPASLAIPSPGSGSGE
jgi:FMN phosphatase YigB (HAD superfamily)